jgi:histidyl-tRNA synthetase
LTTLKDQADFDDHQLERTGAYLDLPEGDLDAASAFFGDQERAQAALESLRQTMALANEAGSINHVKVDLSIARGLDYYTGLIYETQLLELPDMGSVMSGGRYDGLTSMFGVSAQPAIGISLGVDRLFAALIELGRVDLKHSPSTVLLCVFSEETRGASIRLAQELRDASIPTETYLGRAGKLGRQFKYADRKGIPLVAIQGPDEAAVGRIKIKRLEDGREESPKVADLIKTVASLVE